MRDRLFSGTDVDDALASAAASLGLPRAELRYVVLDAGQPGARGLKPTPARIAVLTPGGADPSRGRAPSRRESHEPGGGQAPEPGGTGPGDAVGGPGREARAPRPAELQAGIRAIVRALAGAGDLVLDCEIEDDEAALVVQIGGAGSAFFHGEDGKGEPLRALEHLLQRTYGEALRPRALRLRCAGFRERRDAALTEEARRLAAEVRSTGQAIELEPMNAYERRIVHVALQDEPGVATHSVGEGAARRVRVHPAEPRDEGGA